MRLRIYKTTDVRRDLAEIADYYAHESIDLALRFLDAVDATVAGLLEMPGKGPSCGFTGTHTADLRRYSVGGGFEAYQIFYRIVPDGIEIVRVMHGAREWDKRVGGD